MRPISIIIPVRNEGERLVCCVRSIVAGRSSRFPLELVVVDDASTDGACARLHEAIEQTPEVRLVVRRLERWSGIPYARNRGAEAASYPIYVITDSNTKFPRNWDMPISRWFHRSRLLAGTIVDTASGSRGHGCTLVLPSMGATWLTTPNAHGGYVPVAACTCTVIDRSLFHHLGGYDESLPLYGAAEPEFSVRAWLSGYEIINPPDLLIQHRFRPKSARDAFYTANQRVLLRNYLRFACYYLPDELLSQAYEYFSGLMSADFDASLAELEAGGVWARRAQLSQQLPRDFRWLARRFNLTPVGTSPHAATAAGRLSIVVVTHDPYLRWLPEVLASIHRQWGAIKDVILVVDSAKARLPPLHQFGNIKIVKRKFPSPNHARNAGLAQVKTDWVCYVDGDNIPDDGYFESMLALTRQAPDDVGIIYPDIKRLRPEDGWSKQLRMPEWDYWACRERSIIDTCSAWRTEALRQVGGWFVPAGCLQDYATALKITRQGWKAQKARGITATLREHADNLHKRAEAIPEVLWNCRRLGVVTLFAGRLHCLARLMDWYAKEEFPPDTHVAWIDDSGDPSFQAILRSYAEVLRPRVASIRIWRNSQSAKNISNFRGLHDHVAGMYDRAFRSLLADVYLTVEDDVIAPPGSVHQLLSSLILAPGCRWAGICAVYPSRSSTDGTYMSASANKERWARCPIAGFPFDVVEMGFIGAGFAVWSGAALQKALPLGSSVTATSECFGWDGTLSGKLVKLGYKVGVDGRIRCEHLCMADVA